MARSTLLPLVFALAACSAQPAPAPQPPPVVAVVTPDAAAAPVVADAAPPPPEVDAAVALVADAVSTPYPWTLSRVTSHGARSPKS